MANRMVAGFRAAYDFWAGDSAFMDLAQPLHLGCPEFGGWWKAHYIRNVGAGRKTLIPVFSVTH